MSNHGTSAAHSSFRRNPGSIAFKFDASIQGHAEMTATGVSHVDGRHALHVV